MRRAVKISRDILWGDLRAGNRKVQLPKPLGGRAGRRARRVTVRRDPFLCPLRKHAARFGWDQIVVQEGATRAGRAHGGRRVASFKALRATCALGEAPSAMASSRFLASAERRCARCSETHSSLPPSLSDIEPESVSGAHCPPFSNDLRVRRWAMPTHISRFQLRPSFLATRAANFGSASTKYAKEGSAPGRGITIKSIPLGKRSRLNRKASRSNRFQRFRMTALPTLRETDNPRRAWERSFAKPYTTIRPSATLQWRRKAR
jgi:hypothetical protein